MWMFVIFASVLILMLLGVSTAVTMGFASITTFLLAGGGRKSFVPCSSANVRSGVGDNIDVNSFLPSHGQSHDCRRR